MRKFSSVAVAGGLALSACASTPPPQSTPLLTIVPGDSLPVPSRADLTDVGRPYFIGPFDSLSVDVFGIGELTRVVQVDSSGRISLPIAGDFNVNGKTPAEVAELVRSSLASKYVRDPRVTVNVTEANSQTVTINGEVSEPGVYPISGRGTLLRLLAGAKGQTEFANLTDVVVYRVIDGKQLAALYDVRAIQQGYYADPKIYVNDVVVVGESRARRIFKDVLQGSTLITTPIIALIQHL